jgi:RNA polymerase sigma factor (sigma-70 family)
LPEENDISALIDGCREGNRRAQEQLYKNYYRALMAICMRYTKREEDAVEVLNNGFLKIFRHIGRYDPAQGALYTWMRTVVVNSCLDYIKAQKKRGPHLDLELAEDVHFPPSVVQQMNAAELLALVRLLPPATQGVFNLYVIEGYTHREIGELMGISEGTSKWHLNAARKSLQDRITKKEVKIS